MTPINERVIKTIYLKYDPGHFIWCKFKANKPEVLLTLCPDLNFNIGIGALAYYIRLDADLDNAIINTYDANEQRLKNSPSQQ